MTVAQDNSRPKLPRDIFEINLWSFGSDFDWFIYEDLHSHMSEYQGREGIDDAFNILDHPDVPWSLCKCIDFCLKAPAELHNAAPSQNIKVNVDLSQAKNEKKNSHRLSAFGTPMMQHLIERVGGPATFLFDGACHTPLHMTAWIKDPWTSEDWNVLRAKQRAAEKR